MSYFRERTFTQALTAVHHATHSLPGFPGDSRSREEKAMAGAAALAHGVRFLRELGERFELFADLLPEEIEDVRCNLRLRANLEQLQRELQSWSLGRLLRAIDRHLLGCTVVLAVSKMDYYDALGEENPVREAWWAVHRDLDDDLPEKDIRQALEACSEYGNSGGITK